MLLTINIEDKILNIKEEKDEKKEITNYEKVLNFFLSNTFCINQKLISYKDKNGIVHTNPDNTLEWTKYKYDKEKSDIIKIGSIKRTKEDVFFNEFDSYGIVTKKQDLSPKKLKENLNNFIKEEFGENYKEIILIYYVFYIKKEITIEINNKKKLKKILELNNKEKLIEFSTNKNFKNLKKLAEYMKKVFVKKVYELEISSLKKYNMFFEGKITLPGLYVYRLSYDFFAEFFEILELKK